MARDDESSGRTIAEVCQIDRSPSTSTNLQLRSKETTTVGGTPETRDPSKPCSPEPILPPINRLPEDIFILIPRFFKGEHGPGTLNPFPPNKPLIAMTHVCRSWRTALLSTPSLWTQIDFSTPGSKQAEGFLGRSGLQLIDVYRIFDGADNNMKHFLSAVLGNVHRLRRLQIYSSIPWHLERLFGRLLGPAPELEDLEIDVDADGDAKLPSTIFDGQLPKLTRLSLHRLDTDLRGFNLPSLTWLNFSPMREISVRDLISFFEQCPLLEFIHLSLAKPYPDQPPIPPPNNRVPLLELKELRFNQTACVSGLIDHLILPKCTEMMLEGRLMGEEFENHGDLAIQIHPSSVDHLPATKGIVKVVAMPTSSVLSGPNGIVRFHCSERAYETFNVGFFTSFSPISVTEVKELWVGRYHTSCYDDFSKAWKTADGGIHGAFEVLMGVEDLTIVNCETKPFFSTLGATVDDGTILLPRLRRLTAYVEHHRDIDIQALVQCVKARKEHSLSLGEVVIIFGEEPGADLVKGVELVREFVGKLIYRVGEAPRLHWAIPTGVDESNLCSKGRCGCRVNLGQGSRCLTRMHVHT